MANFCGSGRSNYFKVKDPEKFKEWMSNFGDLSLHKHDDDPLDNQFCILVDSECGDVPNEQCVDGEDEYKEIDFFQELAKFLEDDEVVIFMHCGAEKLRYLSGYATAVNNKGEEKTLAFHHIYELAKGLTSKPENITECSY
jgi:hypothetical protein